MNVDPNFTIRLQEIAYRFSGSIDDTLQSRVNKLVSDEFTPADLRVVVVNYIVQLTRDVARDHTAALEREARDRVHREYEKREQITRSTQAEKNAERRAHVHRMTSGHVGRKSPGSDSRHNYCQNCDECRATKARRAEAMRELSEHILHDTHKYIEDIKNELIVKWTAELLTAEIAMPDGTRTTWGEATIVQHQTRYEMLRKNVTANAVTAAQHAKAIDELKIADVERLNDLVLSRSQL